MIAEDWVIEWTRTSFGEGSMTENSAVAFDPIYFPLTPIILTLYVVLN